MSALNLTACDGPGCDSTTLHPKLVGWATIAVDLSKRQVPSFQDACSRECAKAILDRALDKP